METIDFKTTLDSLREVGFNPMPNQVHITVPDAKDVLWRGLNYFTGGKAQWLPEYDQIVQWLTDNRGRGLLCHGIPEISGSAEKRIRQHYMQAATRADSHIQENNQEQGQPS